MDRFRMFRFLIRRWFLGGQVGSRGLTVILMLVAVILILISVMQLDGFNGASSIEHPEPASLSLQVSQPFAAGYGTFFASIQWVATLFDYAGVLFDGASGARLPAQFRLVGQLDTAWEYPLFVAAWAVPGVSGFSEKDGIPFAEEGARRFPNQWRFRIAWAQYMMRTTSLDSARLYDSLSKILLPISGLQQDVPEYARNLVFTMLDRVGKPDQAMDILVQTYRQVPDPLIRFQFQRKIGDLLWRNDVLLGSDSTAFVGGIGSMLDADSSQAASAKDLLIRLVQPETKDVALQEARQLARQFRAYQAAQLGTQR